MLETTTAVYFSQAKAHNDIIKNDIIKNDIIISRSKHCNSVHSGTLGLVQGSTQCTVEPLV